jgi:hypothetical protein
MLSIVVSYFEMIAKYREGYSEAERERGRKRGQNRSGEFFRKGVRSAFPELVGHTDDDLVDLYREMRNGLYHQGITGDRVVISWRFRDAIAGGQAGQPFTINPRLLVERLREHLARYTADLRAPENRDLRDRFEACFPF